MASPKTIPVGLDISSLFCRVAVDGRIGVVSNTQGARWTVGVVAKEEETDYVFGDAALRLSTHEMLGDAIASGNTAAAQAFLAYLIQLAADNAAVGVEQLRLVVTIPASVVDTAPWVECVTAACKSLISDKKKRKEDFVVGIVTKAAAACVVHTSTGTAKKQVLVVDMDGDSPLQLTVLEHNAGFYTEKSTKSVDAISGPILLTLLATHVATQFERQNKVPRGEVMQSKKAKAKLMKEAERALLSAGTAMTFMLDGLFEGMDCHVNVSKPRWDMMTGSLLKQVEAALVDITDGIDTVRLSGAWATLVKPTLEKSHAEKTKLTATVPTDEAVVLGCAKQAGWITSKQGLLVPTTTLPSIPVSPISIGLADDVVLIPEGMPLPAKIQHAVSKSCKVFQLGPSKVELADLNDVEDESIMTMELSTTGQLSIGFAGQEMVTI